MRVIPGQGRPVRASWLLAGGLFAAVLTLISFFYTAQWYRAGSDNRLLVAIAAEVAANHLKLEPLQVEGAELAPVLAYFTELDFQPVTGPRPVARGATLLGGRYCTIQGVTAAQLRYRAPDGTLSTWYEGTLTGLPLTSIDLWLTSWRDSARVPPNPMRYTTLSRRPSSSCSRLSPVEPLVEAAFL